jgi:hypothetical protein
MIRDMGKSAKWRVMSEAGEQLVRVQSAYHSGRVRLFVDEVLIWNREEGYALWDDPSVIHDFQIDSLACQLNFRGANPCLFVAGQEQELAQ